jgi:predicted dehydrogenase
MATPKIALVGAGGWGGWHLGNITRLQARGAATLVAVCEPRPLTAAGRSIIGPVPVYSEFAALLARHAPAVTVIASPIQTHAELAAAALLAGSDVLVEKPPVTGLAELAALLRLQARTGRAVQVGFQSLGSAAIPALVSLIGSGALGRVRGVGGAGAWVRAGGYFRRAPWAGRRVLGGRPVVDGSLTNPFAHAVATALAVATPGGLHRPLRRVELELFRANDIESDDTACVRIDTGSGPPVVVAATLCAERGFDPWIVVHGEAARAALRYELDRLTVTSMDGSVQRHGFGRSDLLENLLAHRAAPDTVPLLVPLAACRAFTGVVQAVRDAPAPLPLPPRCWHDEDGGFGRHRVIHGVDAAVARAAGELALFSELDLDWAGPRWAGTRWAHVPGLGWAR